METIIGGKGEKVHLAKVDIDDVSDLALDYGVSARGCLGKQDDYFVLKYPNYSWVVKSFPTVLSLFLNQSVEVNSIHTSGQLLCKVASLTHLCISGLGRSLSPGGEGWESGRQVRGFTRRV